LNTNPLRFLLLFGLLGLVWLDGVAAKFKPATSPVFESPRGAEFGFGGFVEERIRANMRNWLLIASCSNVAMLQRFRDPDRTPCRDLVPWAGEFAGKYVICGVQAMRLTQDEKPRTHLSGFVWDLMATPAEDW